MRLARGILRDHGKSDLTRIKILHALFARDQLAVWREDGRNTDQILCGNAGVAQGQLETCKTLLVLAHTFGQKDALGHHAYSQFSRPPESCFELNLKK